MLEKLKDIFPDGKHTPGDGKGRGVGNVEHFVVRGDYSKGQPTVTGTILAVYYDAPPEYPGISVWISRTGGHTSWEEVGHGCDLLTAISVVYSLLEEVPA